MNGSPWLLLVDMRCCLTSDLGRSLRRSISWYFRQWAHLSSINLIHKVSKSRYNLRSLDWEARIRLLRPPRFPVRFRTLGRFNRLQWQLTLQRLKWLLQAHQVALIAHLLPLPLTLHHRSEIIRVHRWIVFEGRPVWRLLSLTDLHRLRLILDQKSIHADWRGDIVVNVSGFLGFSLFLIVLSWSRFV